MAQTQEHEGLTAQEMREAFLRELSDEQLEELAGGINGATRAKIMHLFGQIWKGKLDWNGLAKAERRQIVRQALDAGRHGEVLR